MGEVFAAFHLTDYDKVKVVILGQEPYPQPGRSPIKWGDPASDSLS